MAVKRALMQNEDGIVAITVTILFLIIISLTSLGLARMARREQRQALDNQLSRQALYLAEAGINDAKKAITNTSLTLPNYNTTNKPSCVSDPAPSFTKPNLDFLASDNTEAFSGVIRNDGSLGLGGISAVGSYSCVLIDHDIDNIVFNDVSTTKSVYSEMEVSDAAGMSVTAFNLVIGWNDKSGSTAFRPSGNTDFPPNNAAGWGNNTGVLRMDITNGGNGAFTRDTLSDSTMTPFLYPSLDSPPPASTPTPFDATVNGRAPIIPGACSTTASALTGKFCNVTIKVDNSSKLFLRLKSVYNSTAVNIVATPQSGVGTLKIKGAQTLIDVTGKVADVVKRLQVRVGSAPDASYPEYAVESVEGICKLIQAQPSGGSLAPGIPLGFDEPVCNPIKP